MTTSRKTGYTSRDLTGSICPTNPMEYFKDAQGNPLTPPSGTSQFDKITALWMAHCSSLAYKDKATVATELMNAGFASVQFFDTAETQGFLATYQNDRFAVLAFRGTERNFADIFTDIDILEKRLPEEDFTAHAGFLRGLRRVWGTAIGFTPVGGFTVEWVGAEGVSNALESLPAGLPAYFTGHSLGAALATLAAYKALRLKRRPTALYTFGSPRVAAKELASVSNKQLQGRLHRIVNYRDVVPRVPLPFRFRHVEQLVYFKRNKQRGNRPIKDVLVLILALCDLFLHFILRSRYTPRAFTNHRISEYIDRLS